jgi:hypothetical protein
VKNIHYLLVFLLLNSSCSTILFGTKEKIKITTNVQGIDIELNGKPVARNADSSYVLKVSKRSRTSFLKITKEGYDPQSFTFNRSSRSGPKTLDVLGLIAGGGLLITGTALSQNPIPEEAAKAAPALAVGAALFFPALTDLILKAANTFVHKSLYFNLNPSPRNVTDKDYESILCASVNIKLLPGTVIGNSFIQSGGSFVKKGNYTWEETSNLSIEDLTVLANNEFSNAGYSVPGLKNKFNENDRHSRFVIKAEIKDFEANVYHRFAGFRFSSDVNMKGKILWSIYDNRKQQTVLEKYENAAVWGNDQSMRLLVFNLVTSSVRKLLADKDFIEVTRKTADNGKKAEERSKNDKILISPVPKPEKTSDLVESSLTIDLGDAHGSGVIISTTGYVLTNAHVVKDEKSVGVILSSGLNLTAEVVRVDQAADVALLKLPGKGFKSASISLNEALAGTDVIAIGTPGKIELGHSITKGIISSKRDIDGKVYLQTDVSISPGNSGGPLFNADRELIGLVCSKLIGTGIEGVGFAIPIGVALKSLGIEVK